MENSTKIKLHHWKDEDRPEAIVDDWLAQIAALDLVITVDGSIAHLAGAVGVPVWTLLPTLASWHWLTERDDSIWYPSMKLFRQTKEGDWSKLIKSLEKPLKRMLK
jgi:ADP-heptose:LPS heptosyltransferase